MKLFEWLGWTSRTARPVGRELETTGRTDDEANARNRVLLRIGLFVVLVAITAAAFPKGEVFEYTVQVGDTWRQQTLVAQFNFPIYKDAEKVREEREEARKNTEPYFARVPDAVNRVRANADTLGRQLDGILSAYGDFQYHRRQGESDAAREDSLRYLELRRKARTTLSPTQWRSLTDAYVETQPGLSETTRRAPAPASSRVDDRLLSEAVDISVQLLNIGVMNTSRDSVLTDSIVVRSEEESIQERVNKDNVFGLNEAFASAKDQLRAEFSDNPDFANISFSFFTSIFQPSLRYLRGATMQARDQAARRVTAIRGGVEEGEIVVSKGERITEDIRQKLTSLERVRNERTTTQIVWKQLSGETLFALINFFFFFCFLYILRKDVWRSNRQMIIISLVLSFIIALFAIAVRIPWASMYAVPIALASVVLTIIFNSRIGLFATLVLAFTGGQMLGLDLEYAFASFFAGALGVFSVRDIKNRGQFIVSALLVFAGYFFVLTASYLYLGTPAGRLGSELAFAAVGSSFTITSYLILWALERTFGITTDLTLLELSDTNLKLLKDLSLKAPGSFNHSLQVANLAEAAADRIGANALLTRVGALYHDVGKMEKPEYFVENQRGGKNPHDSLKPRMSALIIASHVKEGLKKAKEEGLPERVLQFIPTHHGTARIEYFYQKAVKDRDEDDSPVLESEFRYPGPRPMSKETGILMLADSIEAASRSLDDPNHKRLKSLIDLIFQERINDGQLDDTDLTFRDLDKIKDTFLQMLLGIYHVRVKYPDQEKEEAEEKEEAPLVTLESSGEFDEIVSILYERDVWGTPEQSISASTIQAVPGVRGRQPHPRMAEASQYHRASRPKTGDGVPPETTPEAGDVSSESDATNGREEDGGEGSGENPTGSAPESNGDAVAEEEGDPASSPASTDDESASKA